MAVMATMMMRGRSVVWFSCGAVMALAAGCSDGQQSGGSFLDSLNPFKSKPVTRASLESGRVQESSRPDGWKQATVDLDLTTEEAPKSLLAVVARNTHPAPGPNGSNVLEGFDTLTLVVRDDPTAFQLLDESEAVLIVGRQPNSLHTLATSTPQAKRAGEELQVKATYALPPGVLDRFESGAPVQLIVSVGGRKITRTIPGAAGAVIQEMASQRPIARPAPTAAGAATSATGAALTPPPSEPPAGAPAGGA